MPNFADGGSFLPRLRRSRRLGERARRVGMRSLGSPGDSNPHELTDSSRTPSSSSLKTPTMSRPSRATTSSSRCCRSSAVARRNVVEIRAHVREPPRRPPVESVADGDSVAPVRKPLRASSASSRRSRAPTARGRYRPPPPSADALHQMAVRAADVEKRARSVDRVEQQAPSSFPALASPEWPDWARGLSPARYAGTTRSAIARCQPSSSISPRSSAASMAAT